MQSFYHNAHPAVRLLLSHGWSSYIQKFNISLIKLFTFCPLYPSLRYVNLRFYTLAVHVFRSYIILRSFVTKANTLSTGLMPFSNNNVFHALKSRESITEIERRVLELPLTWIKSPDTLNVITTKQIF